MINYDLPAEIEEYVHRIGRTGRVGNAGTAISFYTPNDNAALAPKLVKVLMEAKQQVPDFLAQYKDSTMDVDNGEIDERRVSFPFDPSVSILFFYLLSATFYLLPSTSLFSTTFAVLKLTHSSRPLPLQNKTDNPSDFEHRTDSYAHPAAPVEEDDW